MLEVGDQFRGDRIEHFDQGHLPAHFREVIGRLRSGPPGADDQNPLSDRLRFPGQELLDGDRAALLHAGPVRTQRNGARGDDHRIRLSLLHHGGRQRPAQFDLHPRSLDPSLQIVDKIQQAVLLRRHGGEPHLAAQQTGLLEQRHPVPPAGRNLGRLEAAGSASGNPDPLGMIGFCKPERFLISRFRVDGTAHAPFPEVLNAAVAGDAGGDFVEAACKSLLGKAGIGDQGPSHGDQIGLSLPNDPVRRDGILDPSHGDHRDLDDRLDGLGQGNEDALFDVIGGMVQVTGDRVAGGDMEGVGPILLKEPRDAAGLFNLQAPFHILIPAQPADDRIIRSHPPAHGPQHLDAESRSSRQIAPIGVCPVIRKGGEKGAQEVAMGHMQLNAVGAGPFDPFRGRRKRLDDLLHFGNRQLPGRLGHGGYGYGGGADDRHPRHGRRGLSAGVVDLDHDLSRGRMHGIDQAPQGFDMIVAADHEHVGAGLSLREDARMLGVQISHASFGTFLVVGDQPVCRKPLRRGKIGRHGGHHDAVVQFHGSDGGRAEKLVKGHVLYLPNCYFYK